MRDAARTLSELPLPAGKRIAADGRDRLACLLAQSERMDRLTMKFEDIYRFFRDPPPIYLNKELAVCYILSVLLERDSYGTELIQQLEHTYPAYRLSDTVLYGALKFLEDETTIVGYWKKVEGRGRPRRMYQVAPEGRQRARDLARLWGDYVHQSSRINIQSS
ncbi:PadR family transcriptional regulator [Trichothermofontia sichuanensis]|uniref:PadR family transcriptional regulator n=1 Tax=Trichothermofontia sichuanensis TaxID=3045816 RepID=UPI0036F1A9F2